MNQFKRTPVVMLPTNEKASYPEIWLMHNKKQGLMYLKTATGLDGSGQHLYFLSDEEIKEGDWYLQDNKYIYKGGDSSSLDNKRCKKIIATTDSSLYTGFAKTKCPKCNSKMKLHLPDHIKCVSCGQERWNLVQGVYNEIYKLPQPSQQFIEKYVEEYNKGNIITEVMVEYEEGKSYSANEGLIIKNWLKISKDNIITIRKVKDSWNREEVVNLIQKLEKDGADYFGQDFLEIWIEQNLK